VVTCCVISLVGSFSKVLEKRLVNVTSYEASSSPLHMVYVRATPKHDHKLIKVAFCKSSG
jgi:hypothetical protein